MSETTIDLDVIDVTTTDKEPPLLHIMQFDERGAPHDHALCGAKVSKIVMGGRAECKRCVELRMGIDNGKGWWKPEAPRG